MRKYIAGSGCHKLLLTQGHTAQRFCTNHGCCSASPSPCPRPPCLVAGFKPLPFRPGSLGLHCDKVGSSGVCAFLCVFFKCTVLSGWFTRVAGQAGIGCIVCWPRAALGAAAGDNSSPSRSTAASDSIIMNILWEEPTFAVTLPSRSSRSS